MNNFLQSLGFHKDTTAPEGVNRWEKWDGIHSVPYAGNSSYYCSITLNSDCTATEYGFISFYYSDGGLKEKRKFSASITKEDIQDLLNPETNEFNLKFSVILGINLIINLINFLITVLILFFKC